MNWTFYAALGVIKLSLVGGLILLSVLALPIILLLLLLGASLSYLRDVEPKLYAYKFPSTKLANLDLTNIKAIGFDCYSQISIRFQRILMARNKTSY